jgi:SAM-dependent methyltransferase
VTDDAGADLDDDGARALVRVGASLRAAGLTSRALAAWAGTARIAALPARLDAMPAQPMTPAGATLAVFVAGAELAAAELPATLALDELAAHGLVDHGGGRVRARVAIVPLGPGLLVCDRLDAPVERDLVCWPDDSSHHLATAIPPGRRATWLDLGCGSAFAPLARPELAARITGVDLNPRAVHHSRLGAALSGLASLTVALGDLGDFHLRDPNLAKPHPLANLTNPHPLADLVTCNAPIPDPPAPPGPAWRAALAAELWRRAEPGLFDRLWPALRRAVRPGGMIVVHAARDAIVHALADAEGERVVVAYTPDTVRGFAVAWWRPDAPDRLVHAHRALTADRPHLEPRDRDDALAR